MTVLVYSRPGCVQCDMTKRRLKALAVDFEEIDVDTSEKLAVEARDLAAQFGLPTQLPVVQVTYNGEVEAWGGFQPAAIDRIAAILKEVP